MGWRSSPVKICPLHSTMRDFRRWLKAVLCGWAIVPGREDFQRLQHWVRWLWSARPSLRDVGETIGAASRWLFLDLPRLLLLQRKTPLERAERRLAMRRWCLSWRGGLLLLLLTVTTAVAWKGRAVYRELKTYYVEKLIDQAAAAASERDWKTEIERLKLAYQLIRHHTGTLRAIAHHQADHRHPSCLEFFAQLIRSGEATEEDHIDFARAAFRLGRPDLVQALVENLAREGTASAAVVKVLQAEAHAAEKNWSEAVTLARQGVEKLRDTSETAAYSRYVLARLLLQLPGADESQEREAVDLLKRVARRDDEPAFDALLLLIALAEHPEKSRLLAGSPETSGWVKSLEANPRAEELVKVRAWSLRLAAATTGREEVLEQFYSHYGESVSSTLRLEAANWLLRNGAPNRAFDMAVAARFESENWFIFHLDLIAAKGDWTEVARLLRDNSSKGPLRPALRRLFLLRTQLQAGQSVDVQAAWTDIRRESRNEDVRTQLYLAGYAEQTGFKLEAARIYQRTLGDDLDGMRWMGNAGRMERLAGYAGYLRCASNTAELPELAKVVRSFAADFPEIDEVRNDALYLSLLEGFGSPTDWRAAAQALVQRHPQLLAYRSTLALACLRCGDATAAMSVYQNWSTDWSTAQGRYKAVYAAVLQAAGRPAEARRLLEGVQWQALRKEEVQLAGAGDPASPAMSN
jgi:hypothetical protein